MLPQNAVIEMTEVIQRLNSSRYPGILSVGEIVTEFMILTSVTDYLITPIFLLTNFRNTFNILV